MGAILTAENQVEQLTASGVAEPILRYSVFGRGFAKKLTSLLGVPPAAAYIPRMRWPELPPAADPSSPHDETSPDRQLSS